MSNKNPWILNKIVLPQHTDHAGVMWHGSYLNWMEEGRINSLAQVGLTYEEISAEGYEIPVISLEIKYKIPIKNGENITIQTFYDLSEGVKWPCKATFINQNGLVAAISLVELVVVKRSNNQALNLIRKYPDKIENARLDLQKGPH